MRFPHMSSWEYKLISSGPLGFASMQMLEQHLGQLGKDEWEIINFTTKPDNPLVFHGLARRPVARDWFPPADAKPAYTPPPIPKEVEEDERDERSFADELPPARPANAPAPADLGLGDFDDLGGSEEDLPTLFEAIKPFLRKNPRGDFSVELDFLAKKFEQDVGELQTAFEECGLVAPAQSDGKGDVVDHDGSLYWLERDKRGRIWVNTRDKKFRTAKTTPVPAEPQAEHAAPAREQTRQPARDSNREPAPARPIRAVEQVFAGTDSLLDQIRGMMRRNRRGHGWSGSFQYLTKALKLDDTQLLEKLGEFGLRLEGGDKPVLATEGNFTYYLNKNQRGEIWINADETGREPRAGRGEQGARKMEDSGQGSEDRTETPEDRGRKAETFTAPAGRSQREYVDPREEVPAKAPLPPENTLTAVRLLMQPKKRGEGVTVTLAEVATKLEKTEEQMLAVLGSAGLYLPESPKAKPTFAEHGGEIFWLNANAKGQVWLNAKQTSAKKSRAKK